MGFLFFFKQCSLQINQIWIWQHDGSSKLWGHFKLFVTFLGLFLSSSLSCGPAGGPGGTGVRLIYTRDCVKLHRLKKKNQTKSLHSSRICSIITHFSSPVSQLAAVADWFVRVCTQCWRTYAAFGLDGGDSETERGNEKVSCAQNREMTNCQK